MRPACTALLIVLCGIPFAQAQTTRYAWTNSPSPATPFTNWDTAARSLQEAIDACAAGDTVVATDGVYETGGRAMPGLALTNRVLITNAITLRSVNGPLSAIIRGQGPAGASAVRGAFLTNGATLSGFLVENGWTLDAADPGAGADKTGAGVLAFAGCMVTNCHLNNNTASGSGGGFSTASGFGLGDPTLLVDCMLEYNTSSNGGGAYLFGGSISHCTFRSNTVTYGFGGGAFAVNAEVSDCLFVGNLAILGGGLALAGNAARITAISNMAAVGGGIYGGEAILEDVQLIANSASTNGGGAFLETCWLTGGVISNNDLTWGGGAGDAYGAGIACMGARIVGCTIENNRGNDAADRGGGVACYPRGTWTNEFLDCRILGNTAGDGGGIFVLPEALCELSATGTNLFEIRGNAATNYGGGACVSTQAVFHAAGRILVAANSAANGGGLAVRAGSTATVEEAHGDLPVFRENSATNCGGGLFAAEANTLLALRNVQIGQNGFKEQGNTALGGDTFSGGGGMAAYGGATVVAIDTVFDSNLAPQGHGGAILLHNSQAALTSTAPEDPVTALPRTLFLGNRATNLNGGAIYAYDSQLVLQNIGFFSNRAARGGAIHVDTGSNGRLDNLVIADNLATANGGGVRIFDGGTTATVCNLRHCTVYSNGLNGVSLGGPAIVSLTNCIVFSNAGVEVSASATVAYSDIEGGFPGTGNVDVDPAFRNPAAHDFHLTYASVTDVSDTGTDAGLTNDCVFRARPISFGFDMGAYEYEIDYDDSDGDGIPDYWESLHSMDPGDPSDGPAHDDTDGVSNYDEYLADTNPQDEADYFRLTDCYHNPDRPDRGILVGFASSAERLYTLYYTDNLSNDCAWATIPDQILQPGAGTEFDGLSDTNAPGIATTRNYRVTVAPIPE